MLLSEVIHTSSSATSKTNAGVSDESHSSTLSYKKHHLHVFDQALGGPWRTCLLSLRLTGSVGVSWAVSALMLVLGPPPVIAAPSPG